MEYNMLIIQYGSTTPILIENVPICTSSRFVRPIFLEEMHCNFLTSCSLVASFTCSQTSTAIIWQILNQVSIIHWKCAIAFLPELQLKLSHYFVFFIYSSFFTQPNFRISLKIQIVFPVSFLTVVYTFVALAVHSTLFRKRTSSLLGVRIVVYSLAGLQSL